MFTAPEEEQDDLYMIRYQQVLVTASRQVSLLSLQPAAPKTVVLAAVLRVKGYPKPAIYSI